MKEKAEYYIASVVRGGEKAMLKRWLLRDDSKLSRVWALQILGGRIFQMVSVHPHRK